MVSLRTLRAVFSFKIQTALQYRTEMVLWVVLDTIPSVSLFFLFHAIFAGQAAIRGISLRDTVEFYFFVSLIQAMTHTHFEAWRSEEIRLGKIDFLLVKPYSYVLDLLLTDLASKLLHIILLFPWYGLLLLATQWYFSVTLFNTISLAQMAWWIGLLLCAYAIQFLLSTTIVVLTFWFEGAEGLQHFKWILVTVLSGAMIPFALMPTWMQTLIEWFPLRFLATIPITVLQGTYTLKLQDGLTLALTLLGLGYCNHHLIRHGIKRYTSAGG